MADEPSTPGGEALTLERPAERPSGPRRRALWGALAVVAIAAGALVITSSRGDGGPPTLPVSLAGASNEAAMSGAADMALAWMHYVAGEDLPTLGGSAPAYRLRSQADEASVQRLASALGFDGEIERDGGSWRVADGDRELNVDVATGSWWFGSRSVDDVGTADGSASSGTASGGAGDYGCEPGPAVDCAVAAPVGDPTPTTFIEPCPSGGCAEPAVDPAVEDCFVDCVTTLPADDCPPEECEAPEPLEPQPAADLPAEADARQIALDVIGATGADVSDARVTLDGPYDAWYVTVEHTVDGVAASGWASYVVVGPEGALLHASGFLVTAERLGDYALIDTRAAVDRLNALQGAWSPYGGDTPAIAGDDAGATVQAGTSAGSAGDSVSEPGDAGERCAELATPEEQADCAASVGATDTTLAVMCEAIPPGAEPATDPCPVDLPMPIEPVEPAPLEVVLTSADQVLVMLYATDGSPDTYLVPGYRMTSDDGMVSEVAAVADEALAPTTVPETTVPEPAEPPVTEPGTAPAPDDCQTLVEDDGSGTTHTMYTCPGEIPPSDPEVVRLSDGEQPLLGVPYYVDVDVECGAFELGGQVWTLEKGDTSGWSTPHEGGTFTLETQTSGTFRGDAQATKTATFAQNTPANGCLPTPR